MQTTRNSVLVTKAIYNYIIASILAMVAQQVNTTVDAIIVGKIVSPAALSAITVFLPVRIFMEALAAFVVSGATVLLAGYIGERDQNKIDRTLAAVFVCVCALAVICAVLAVYAPNFAAMLCEDTTIRSFLTDYMTVYLLGGGAFMLYYLMLELVNVNGQTTFLAKVTVMVTLINIVMDYAFVAWLGMGISGSAIATVLAMFIGSMVFLAKLHKECLRVFLGPFRLFSLSFLKDNLARGLPLIIGNLTFAVTSLGINTIVMDRQGADGMFALSVSNQVLFIGLTLALGICYSVTAIGPFLLGQNDIQGFSFLVKRCLMLIVSVSLFVVLATQVFPSALTGLFGADTQDLANYTNEVICVTSWIVPPFLLLLFFSNLYFVQNLLGLSVVPILLFPICLIPSLLLMGEDGDMWLAFPVGGVAMLLLLFAVTEVFRHKRERMAVLTLLPEEVPAQTYGCSVKNDDRASVYSSLDGLVEWLQEQPVSSKVKNDINLCIEELLINIVNYSDGRKASRYTDIHISIQDGYILASIKDSGKPFDPTVCPEEQLGLGLKIVKDLCPQFEYKYMYGQNVTFLKWIL